MVHRIRASIVGVALGLLAAAASAQPYPNKPVRIVIPFGAGGSTDVLIRIVGARMPELLGQQVVMDNRTGAGSMIGTDIVAKAAPDGYTLLGAGSPYAIVPNLYKKVPYNVRKDFTPIMQIASQPYGLVVHPSLNVRSVKELIDLAKKEPGKHNYASSGQGGAMHLFQALFTSMAGIDMVHVPYKGSGPVRADLLGGQIKIGCLGLSSIISNHRAGQIRIIAVTSAKRTPALPDIPAISETLPGYDATLWTGFLAPRGTPAPIIKRLHADISKIMQMPQVRTAYEKAGTDIVVSDPQTFGKFLETELQKWAKVVRDLKLQIQ